MTNIENAPAPIFYTMEEVAATFKISRSHAYRLKREQNWPHHRFGHEIRFSTEDIEAIKAMYRKTPLRDPGEAQRSHGERPRIGVGYGPRPRIGTRAQRSQG